MQQPTQPIEGQRNAGFLCAQAAHHGRAAADGDDGDAVLTRDSNDAHDLVMAARAYDEIGHVIDRPGPASRIVDEGGAARRGESVRPRIAHMLIADDRAEGVRHRSGDPRGGQSPRRGIGGRPRAREADVLRKVVADARRELRGVGRIAPSGQGLLGGGHGHSVSSPDRADWPRVRPHCRPRRRSTGA